MAHFCFSHWLLSDDVNTRRTTHTGWPKAVEDSLFLISPQRDRIPLFLPQPAKTTTTTTTTIERQWMDYEPFNFFHSAISQETIYTFSAHKFTKMFFLYFSLTVTV
jgi:hypothetical protein